MALEYVRRLVTDDAWDWFVPGAEPGSPAVREEVIRIWRQIRELNRGYDYCADGDHKQQVRSDIGRLVRYLKTLREPMRDAATPDSPQTYLWLGAIQPG